MQGSAGKWCTPKWFSEADAGPGAEADAEAGAGIRGFPKWTKR